MSAERLREGEMLLTVTYRGKSATVDVSELTFSILISFAAFFFRQAVERGL
jgi:hypothetical protein